MNDSQESTNLNEMSPSVQTHLGIIQGVIQRMAANSASSKAWCITIVSAILVIVADKGNPEFAWLALLPTVSFAALDVYYLALEKAFRQDYRAFVEKLHTNTLQPDDLYSIAPRGSMTSHQIDAIKSFSVWGFYVSLLLLVFLAKTIVLS